MPRYFISRNLSPAIRQSVRLSLSIFLAALIAYLCELREPYWALITSIIVTQSRIVQTLNTSRNQIVGSLIGGIAGIVAIAMHEYFLWPVVLIFIGLVIPMVALVSWRPSMRLGLVTLVIVFLFPSLGGPFERPFDRIFSIVVGVIASLIASYFILRPQARQDAFTNASAVLDKIYTLLHTVLTTRLAWEEVESMNDGITENLRNIVEAISEARIEQPGYSLEHSDPALVRLYPILRRLQNDTIFVARAIDVFDKRLPYNTILRITEALDNVFTIMTEQCDQQANYSKAPSNFKSIPELQKVVAPILQEAEHHCPPTVKFTLEALGHDLIQAQNIFWPQKKKTQIYAK